MSGRRRFALILTTAVLAFAVLPALAGPGFVGSSRVSVEESDAGNLASIEIQLNCKTQYLGHDPSTGGDRLRIYLEPTSICNGVSPTVANTRGRLRPFNADVARLVDLTYDGTAASGAVLTLSFSENVAFDVEMDDMSFDLTVNIRTAATEARAIQAAPSVDHRQVVRETPPAQQYIVNLVSLQRIPTIADAPQFSLTPSQRLFYSEADVDGTTWYRLRLGVFDSPGAAREAMLRVQSDFPGAWIAQFEEQPSDRDLTAAARTIEAEATLLTSDEESGDAANAKIDALMEDARRAIIAGETSRAIQIYTKILQLPDNRRHPEAQEYLALAREKNGQVAHAKAEYQRYLSQYPDSEGASRVSQRLAALLANSQPLSQPSGSANTSGGSKQSSWRIQTFVSQYYRRDVNQPNDREEIVSQSALYTDLNVDARHRGERFDFSSRVSAGYRSNFLEDTGVNSGNSTRVSYAYADLADSRSGLRGRLGRQSRSSGGVLGRFDGLNLGYEVGENLLVSAVLGKPAYSSSDGIDSSRSFYGISVDYGPIIENLELGLFYIQQDIDNIRDRQAVGGEFRYFGEKQSLWGMLDYDLHFGELANAFLQATWRFESRLSIHALANKRSSPFLSTGNAIIGQPVATFAELAEIFSAAELTELGRDRSPASTNISVGLSYPISPRLQINSDLGRSTIDDTPASGGVLATPGSTYTYFSTSLLASSLIKEGDVIIVGLRIAESDTSNTASLTLDSRYPISRAFRINARLRVDRRELVAAGSEQWLYTPGIRLQYRRNQRFRLEFEAGKMFSEQDSDGVNQDRESYFVNLGYQLFF